ncbi:MAG TPA: UDP-N-acetylglucosamine--N-acetylmuramyl-(pentapeptide) pyrophosphoryl-undecaprenol N-acetylglucosamine transferase [Spirochaetia bacterium]|nr:UDP-N-acetylglucosamine--N-acetylmuramyl-(pentapeptide) pyrophosphoryl-undecaprenol N-acetylglucosamine transferase [Spirochaetia bacterium]
MSQSIVFTGGGSGGHVFPGLAVLEVLRSRWVGELHWIGSGKGMEREIVEEWGIPFHSIPAGKLRREFSLKNAIDLFKVFGGIIASYAILRKIGPAALFSKGGYVSVPPVIAARILRIPVLTHESDSDPGLATRINARFSETIFVAYPETKACFADEVQRRVVVSGNPVRSDVFRGNSEAGRRFVNAPGGRPLLLVLGGSQGARRINRMIGEALPSLREHFYVVHQTGSANDSPGSEQPGHYFPVPFLRKEYGDVLAAADLVVSRAGAGTLWEIAVAGKPSILIPLAGSGTRGDQVRNAGLFAGRGASIVLNDDVDGSVGSDGNRAPAGRITRELDVEADLPGNMSSGTGLLVQAVASLAGDPARLKSMAVAASSIGNRDAAERIVDGIVNLARRLSTDDRGARP